MLQARTPQVVKHHTLILRREEWRLSLAYPGQDVNGVELVIYEQQSIRKISCHINASSLVAREKLNWISSKVWSTLEMGDQEGRWPAWHGRMKMRI